MNKAMVIAAQSGKDEAIATLIKSVQDDGYRIAYSYLKNEHDSMDAVCAGVEKAIRSIKKLKQPEYFKTWFIRIVINESKVILKKRAREIIQLSIVEMIEVSDHSDDVSLKYDIQLAMDKLSVEHKEIVNLKYFTELTFTEISEVTGLPESTVKSKLYKALKLLKKSFK